jgi:phospholipid/cholesterol/gamma-HCH transport system substrate-binding protein
MSHPKSWKNLSLGLVCAAAVIGAALAILVFGRVGTLRGEKFRMYVTTDAARGLIRGSEVWLDGQRIGNVAGVEFRPATASSKERLVLKLELLEKSRSLIRKNSRARIQAGTSVIAEQVVYIQSGTLASAEIADGDTLRASTQNDVESMSSDAALASRELPAILSNVKLLGTQLEATQEALSSIVGEDGRMRVVRARAARVMAGLSGANGSLRPMLGARELVMQRAERARAQFDSIRALLASNEHSLGRFRRDSTIMLEVAHLRNEVAEIKRLAESPDGTIGRLRTDSAIVRGVHRDLALLDSLIADMKKRPLRYIAF